MIARAVGRLVVGILLANGVAAVIVWACGPDLTPIPTMGLLGPVDPRAFEAGELGVIRPRFRRAALARAYFVLTATRPVARPTPAAPVLSAPAPYPPSEWAETRASVLGPPAASTRKPRLINYVTPVNCLEDAYATAMRSFRIREARYGAGSGALRDWVRAQDAVFANCDEEPLLLPEPAPAAADALTKADRAYQTAAAYFYALQYEEAERRFLAIGDDTTSPWRPYGRYLAARARLRSFTMAEFVGRPSPEALGEAEKQFEAVLADPVAAPVHASTRGLLGFVRLRVRPQDELRRLSAALAAGDPVPERVAEDFTYLLNRAVGDTVDFAYADVATMASLRDTHDLVDWVLAVQGMGPGARDRAIERWQATRSLPWLVAALWHLGEPHPVAAAVLEAAAQVPATSAGFATVAFLRVRLLLALGQHDAARGILARLPNAAGPGVSAETINLYRGERFMSARTLEELLVAAPRTSVPTHHGPRGLDVFDEDAGVVFSERLPLDRLVEAAQSTRLPPRLRTRVATAAFTRAVALGRHDRARAVAPVLRALAPAVAADLDRLCA